MMEVKWQALRSHNDLMAFIHEIRAGITDEETFEKFNVLAAIMRDWGYRHPEEFPLWVKDVSSSINRQPQTIWERIKLFFRRFFIG
jgi:hypothetical protein